MPTPQEALVGVRRLGLDTAPIISFIEQEAAFLSRARPFFDAIERGNIAGVTTLLTLSEVLVHPLRHDNEALADLYRRLLLYREDIETVPPTQAIAERAALLRARHRFLRLPDALQVATAIETGCDAFLTNDDRLTRITEIRTIALFALDEPTL